MNIVPHKCFERLTYSLMFTYKGKIYQLVQVSSYFSITRVYIVNITNSEYHFVIDNKMGLKAICIDVDNGSLLVQTHSKYKLCLIFKIDSRFELSDGAVSRNS